MHQAAPNRSPCTDRRNESSEEKTCETFLDRASAGDRFAVRGSRSGAAPAHLSSKGAGSATALGCVRPAPWRAFEQGPNLRLCWMSTFRAPPPLLYDGPTTIY